ncbi:hypothetical protein FRC00_013812 [Tulasnella sp. 408]|nr:hypothetical protein FRC00_013812 [Tulasnella sp. 408]
MNTPRIWSEIQWRRDDHLRLLRMSAQAPLMIRCSGLDGGRLKEPGTTEEFLNAVREHSERWKALSLDLQFDGRRLPSLEFPAPQLRNLHITNRSDPYGTSPDFIPPAIKISGNPSLRNLALTKTSLQWDGIDFSRLKSLSLNGIQQGPPSLENLLETLMMASCLESLSLRKVNTVSLTKVPQLESQPIDLNSLITLSIDEMPRGLADYLITRIRAPRLKTSNVHGLFLKHLENPNSDQNPYHHFFRVIMPTLAVQGSINLALNNDIFSKAVSLGLPLSADGAIRAPSFGMEAESPIRGGGSNGRAPYVVSH